MAGVLVLAWRVRYALKPLMLPNLAQNSANHDSEHSVAPFSGHP